MGNIRKDDVQLVYVRGKQCSGANNNKYSQSANALPSLAIPRQLVCLGSRQVDAGGMKLQVSSVTRLLISEIR